MIKRIFCYLVYLILSVSLFGEIEITIDVLAQLKPDTGHELNRIIVFDNEKQKFLIVKTFVFSGEKAEIIKSELLKSVDVKSLTGWAGNQPEYYFNIVNKESGNILFKGILSFRSETWMVFDAQQKEPSIEAVSDVKQLRKNMTMWGVIGKETEK